MLKCDRCRRDAQARTGSWFNQDMICLSCAEKEEAHPKFKLAQDRERAEVKKGNLNYEGIGLPSDLWRP